MPKVIIIGGGVAGLSAAHELIERGFDIEVYEANPSYIGGKARSEDVPGSDILVPGKFLPGEHGFRFFPGFYQHITDTMKRIPYEYSPGNFNARGCFDNLVDTSTILLAREGLDPLKVVARFPIFADDFEIAIESVNSAGTASGLTGPEKDFFKRKMFQLITTGNKRFENEYEQTAWWYYVEADRFSNNYRTLLADGLTKSLVAAKAKKMSTRVGGSILLQLLYTIAEPGTPADRVLNGPTNDKWLNPWHSYLVSKGVIINRNHKATEIRISGNQVADIKIRNFDTGLDIFPTADYYLLSVPVEKAASLITPVMTSIDPSLNFPSILANDVSWMNGIQYYLNIEIPINHGHIIHIDSKWAVTSISQMQFWNGYDLASRFDGSVKGILSVDISDWLDTVYNGQLPKDCTDDEIALFTYEQIQKSLIIEGIPVLPVNMNAIVVKYFIGSGLTRTGPNTLRNDEPLLVNTVNSWDLMPKAWSQISNLFLASDYARTNTGLATMEAANEAARRAVNCIIDASGVTVPYAKIWKLKEWALFKPYKWYDTKRYEKGLPYTADYPIWLKIIAMIWAVLCILAWAIRYLFNLIF